MHIEKDAAALLAQVIPTLLIVLVLEGRLAKPQGKPTFWRKAHAMLRNLTAFLSLGAEAACLFIVMGNDTPSSSFTDAGIVIGVLLLLVSVYLMLLRFMMGELRDNT